MDLFHGSHSRFRQFKIHKNLSNQGVLMEGLAIYMTDIKNIKVAKGYGQYLYKIDIDRSQVLNMSDARVVRRIVRDSIMSAKVVPPNVVINEVVRGILDGNGSVVNGHKTITDWLDSLETFYDRYGNRSEQIFTTIEKTYNKLIRERHVIKYFDKTLGTVYICIHHPEQLKIVGVQIQK